MDNLLQKIYEDKDFIEIIDDIIKNDTVKKMRNFKQHYETSCFDHCLVASYYCYLYGKKFNFDYVSCARAAMLHDLFLYDWRKSQRDVEIEGLHAFAHPKIALKNASKIFDLNNKEQDIIVTHMWPVTLSLQKYKESFVITFADKYSALKESFNYYFK